MTHSTVKDCVSSQVLSQSDVTYYYFSDIDRIINYAIMASLVWLLLLLTIATDAASSADITTITSSSISFSWCWLNPTRRQVIVKTFSSCSQSQVGVKSLSGKSQFTVNFLLKLESSES